MKTTERVTELEALVGDLQRQMKESQRQLAEVRKKLNIKTDDKCISFAEEVVKRMEAQGDHPFMRNRGLYNTDDLLNMVTQLFGEEQLASYGVRGEVNSRKRSLCTKLVNSGLFMRLKGQQYVSAAGFEGAKPYSRKYTVIVANDFKKYTNMTQNKLYDEMKRQEQAAIDAVEEEIMEPAREAQKKAEVAKEVSFL